MKHILVVVFFFLSLSFSFSQTTLVLKPDAAIGEDAAVWRLSDDCIPVGNTTTVADINLGNYIETRYMSWTWSSMGCGSGDIRSLIRFSEISLIPSGAIIISAHLNLFGPHESPDPTVNSVYPGTPYVLDNSGFLQRITSSWEESSVTWNTQPSATSLNEKSIPISTSKYGWDVSIDVTDFVAGYADGSFDNYGFLLRQQTEAIYRSIAFASSDNEDETLWPELVIVYECREDGVTVHDTTCDIKTISGRPEATEYLWSTGVVTRDITVEETGTYWVRSDVGCIAIDTFYIDGHEITPPDIDVSDIIVCPEENEVAITVDVNGETDVTYGWSPIAGVLSGNDQANATVNPNVSEKFIITVTRTEGICRSTARDTVQISKYDVGYIDIVGADDILCNRQSAEIAVQPDDFESYHWKYNDLPLTGNSSKTTISAFDDFNIYVGTMDANGCGLADSAILKTEPCCTLLMPNAFSPNGDGINDVFCAVGGQSIENIFLQIFDRWGQRVFFSYNPAVGWDGSFKGTKCDVGTYFYHLSYKCDDEMADKRGDITLIK